jgi:hypothetical protein
MDWMSHFEFDLFSGVFGRNFHRQDQRRISTGSSALNIAPFAGVNTSINCSPVRDSPLEFLPLCSLQSAGCKHPSPSLRHAVTCNVTINRNSISMNDLFLWEVEDARNLILEMQGDPTAFDFAMLMPPEIHDESDCIRYTVAVTFDCHQVQYLGGYGLNWVDHLEIDLCRGVFGCTFKEMR